MLALARSRRRCRLHLGLGQPGCFRCCVAAAKARAVVNHARTTRCPENAPLPPDWVLGACMIEGLPGLGFVGVLTRNILFYAKPTPSPPVT